VADSGEGRVAFRSCERTAIAERSPTPEADPRLATFAVPLTLPVDKHLDYYNMDFKYKLKVEAFDLGVLVQNLSGHGRPRLKVSEASRWRILTLFRG
jgi:hypothetical protein